VDQAGNSSLSTLITQCMHQPNCLYAMSSEVTKARVTQWLRKSQPRRIIPVWVWLHYPNGPPPRHIQLNIRALQLHAPPHLFRVIFLNSSTIQNYITLPREWYQLRHVVASSDVARLGLLATHGGMYVDADILVTSSLQQIIRILDEYEMVVYTSPGQDCRIGIFSSNFIATRPNASLWTRSWKSIVAQLGSRCGGRRRRKICCYAQNGSAIPCRTPWGLTDFIMRPVAMEMVSDMTLSAHCLGMREGPTPHAYAHAARFTPTEASCVNYLHVYTNPLGVGYRLRGQSEAQQQRAQQLQQRLRRRTGLNGSEVGGWFCGDCISYRASDGPNATMCCRRVRRSLQCRNARGYITNADNFFNRWAYHLFESVNGKIFSQHALAANGKIEDADLAVSALYRKALGLGKNE
jgi:hypothetical protein